MARYRIALATSAFPGLSRGAEVEVDADDPAMAARIAAGVLVRVAAPSSPEAPTAAPVGEERSRGGRRGRDPKPEPEQGELATEPADEPAAEPSDSAEGDEDSAARAEGDGEEA
jgi:hypothetical protein